MLKKAQTVEKKVESIRTQSASHTKQFNSTKASLLSHNEELFAIVEEVNSEISRLTEIKKAAILQASENESFVGGIDRLLGNA